MANFMRQVEESNPSSPDTDAKTKAASTDPPSYDYATGEAGSSNVETPAHAGHSSSENVPDKSHYKLSQPMPGLQPTYAPVPAGTLYHYQHPVTGHLISTPLPPDNPEMICLQSGSHVRATRFGLLGVLAAVFWFPLGIGLCLLDRRVYCKRCGAVIDDGLTC